MGFHTRHESHPPVSISRHMGTPCSTSMSNICTITPRPPPSPPEHESDADLPWPFGKLDEVDKHDIRETAYEVFFTSCRSSPGFGGRNALAFYSSHDNHNGDNSNGPGSPGSPGSSRGNGVGMVTNSRIKRALGLRTLRRVPSRRSSLGGGIGMGTSSPGGGSSSPNALHGHAFGHVGHSHSGGNPGISFTVPSRSSRRPLTSAEIMRLQMRVTEQSDSRLRKTLMRTLVGQMGRRAETIILPLELLRHLKPSEFRDHAEYHFWQKRQLKILETGLILHPLIPLDQPNSSAAKLREIIRVNEDKPIDTGKNSEIMKQLCNCILSLAWRGANGNATDVCHWADGYPLNLHIYVALLQSIFDHKDETAILDEVDELIELMKKTWTTLGINRSIHNVCFTYVLFQQYVLTGQIESDLLCATLSMLVEVATDAKRTSEHEPIYVKNLASVMSSIIGWSEKKLLDYHEAFPKGNTGMMENLLPLVLQARKILDEDVSATIEVRQEGEENSETLEATGDRVDFYIRSSVRSSFTKMAESMSIASMQLEGEKEVSDALMDLAQGTEDLAAKEKESYSNTLKRWHSVSAAIAAVTLHNCYGAVLQQYLTEVSMLTTETINVLHRAGRLEKILVQMIVEDTVECEDGGKSIVREMVPYEVDSVIISLLRKWIEERLRKGKDCVQRAKETETWNPKSKAEPFAQSAMELMKIAKQTIDDFFEIPVGLSDDLVQNLADGLERVIREYSSFVASCGTKQSYVPTLPPLTRCSRDSKFAKLWKRAGCNVGMQDHLHHYMAALEGHHARPSTSRGTQRLYIRLNTLHYLLSHLNSLDKALALSPRVNTRRNLGNSTSYFELARASMQGAIQHVAEVSGYRLIFLDSNSVMYESLYVFNVPNSRIRPALRILKQNLTLLGAILIDHAQPLAVKEVMKSAFEAYLMVLLAGGSTRTYCRSDYEMISEDFESLKRVFCTCGVGLITEEDVDKEAEVVEGVVQLMGQSTEQLIEDFSIVACEKSGFGVNSPGKKLPMPPTTGRWNRADPNTILRVLCHRNDRGANLFLKRTFQLPKRR
ncbi:hypothetical protein RND81_14G134900 [Saponaria officinalis]|uniref:Uncharacterized protein n=1 Tax=Saponaria officinalis TaxID=3572 RepID=A0AAW1GQ54_SAPOF